MVVLEKRLDLPIGQYILGLIDSARDGASPELGGKVVSSIVKGLAERGEYQTLVSTSFHKELEVLLDKFPKGVVRDNVRYESVDWFIRSVEGNIRNRKPEEVELLLSDEQKQLVTQQAFDIFGQLAEIQGIMAHYPDMVKVTHKLMEISNTPLVWSETGIFHSHDPYDRNEQRCRMVLLAIPGLRLAVAESVVDLVQYAPSTSRRGTGMLPSAMLTFRDLLHPDDRQGRAFQEYRDWVARRALYGWPTPPPTAAA